MKGLLKWGENVTFNPRPEEANLTKIDGEGVAGAVTPNKEKTHAQSLSYVRI